ncbi:WhiB family transcriptional regulator [Specibacter sp. NPDC057265]|uniref:WhiB family transcriptional regulator n=1 Tax=Specibacter sp. NPDC057265 TaxID=3346075 RepID=UPI003629AC3F
MGQVRPSVTAVQEDSTSAMSMEAQAAATYRSRGIPTDWYVDPADPTAAEFHERENQRLLDAAATAFLDSEDDAGSQPSHAPAPERGAAEAIWIGLKSRPDEFSDEGELGWQSDALCAQTDPEAFFPEKGGSTRDAKKVCGACNVKAQCLEYALANDERFGIWGGLSERERRRLRKRAV